MSDHSHKPNWPRVPFAAVVRLNTDRVADPAAAGIERYVGIEHITPGDLRVRSWGLVAEGTTFTNRFQPGQVLFPKRRAYQRKVAVADFEGVCSGDIYVFESRDPAVLLPDLLPFICQTDAFFDHAIGTSAGSLSPRTNWSHLAAYEFPLPPPDEQRRLVEVLGAMSAVGESYRSLALEAERLWQSLAFKRFSDAYACGKLMRLSDLLVYASDGPFGSKLKTKHYDKSGARVIRLQNIDANSFNDTDRAYISEEYYRSVLADYAVYPGDVLVAGLGDDSIRSGRACIAPANLGPAINKADCYCLRPGEKLDAEYLVAFFNSPQGADQSKSFAQGTTRIRLNLGNIRRMKVPVPEIDLQRQIAAELANVYQTGQDAQLRLVQQGTMSRLALSYLD